MHTINRNTPPSSPEVLRGTGQISEFVREVCSREISHRVEDEVVTEGYWVPLLIYQGGEKATFSIRMPEVRRIWRIAG